IYDHMYRDDVVLTIHCPEMKIVQVFHTGDGQYFVAYSAFIHRIRLALHEYPKGGVEVFVHVEQNIRGDQDGKDRVKLRKIDKDHYDPSDQHSNPSRSVLHNMECDNLLVNTTTALQPQNRKTVYSHADNGKHHQAVRIRLLWNKKPGERLTDDK